MSDLEQFNHIENVRLDFVIMSLEVEKKMKKRF